MTQPGKLTLIFGSMFSGKTGTMLHDLRRAEIAGQVTILFKPTTDTRYSNIVRTHDGRESRTAHIVQTAAEILTLTPANTTTIGIEETQFFDKDLVPVIQQLIAAGKQIICTGLDMWANGKPIDIMGSLACIADEVIKLKAVCTSCGQDAYLSHRKQATETIIDVGGADKYTVLCRNCLKAYHSPTTLTNLLSR